jgi:hypothetical protein
LELGSKWTDAKALAYGGMLGVPVVTDDRDMTELGQAFGIEMRGLLDLLKIMHAVGQIDWKAIKTLLDYLEYIKDLPYPSFRQEVSIAFKKNAK